MALSLPRAVLVRRLDPSAFVSCLRSDDSLSIDAALAVTQHAGYVKLLESLGVAVTWITESSALPDAVFIEDAAVMLTDRACVVTNPGAPSRQPETDAVCAALETSGYDRISRMDPGGTATLDGGDVLRAGPSQLFVGLSSRTNAAGAAFLAAAAGREGIATTTVAVPAGLHLKSAVTALDDRTLVYDPGALHAAQLDPLRSAGFGLLATPESLGANLLALGPCVICSESAPLTIALLRGRGVDVSVVGVGELHKADGALTCLSLRLPPPGGWVT